MRFIQRMLTRWSANYHARKRATWGIVTDPRRSGWDTDHAQVDLLAKMVGEQKRRVALPKGKLP